MPIHPRTLLVTLALLLATARPAAADSVVVLGDDPRVAGLSVTAFAEGLDFPTGMAALPDGALLVATSRPTGGSLFASTGTLLRLTDEDRDGRADDAGTPLATGLPGTLVSLAVAGDLVLTMSAESRNEQIVVLRRGETWADPLEPAGALRLGVVGFQHQSYGLAACETGEGVEVIFNVGASGNDTAGRTAYASGITDGALQDASLYRIVITDPGSGDVSATEPELVATGLRNAAAVAFDPETGDLLVTDNGIDTPGNAIVALSADELHVLPAEEIGGEVEDYGFPAAYVDYATGDTVGVQPVEPAVAYRPLDGPDGPSEAEGVASVAPAPAAFPEDLRGGVFAGFHGQYDSAGLENEENPLLWSDPATGESIEVFANGDPTLGHVDGLLATAGTLYAADLCAGSLTTPGPCGAIYAVTAG